MSENQDKDTRSAKQIERDLERSRQELSATINELTSRVSPKAGIESAKEGVASLANDTAQAVRGLVDDTSRQLGVLADEASMHAKTFAADVRRGDVKTIALAGGVVAGVVGLIALAVRR